MALSVTGPINVEGFITRDFMSGYRVVWNVASATTDGPKAVAAAVGIDIGDPYFYGSESDDNSFCTAVSAKIVDHLSDGLLWEVEVNYEPFDTTLFQRNPLDCRPEISWDFVQFDEEIDEDIYGNPISNTATVPFNPKIKRDQSRPVLTIARNEQSYSPSGALYYIDKINIDSFFGFGPGQVKVGNITAAELWHPVCGRYVRVNYIFHIKREGWRARILNAGFQQMVDGVVVPILNKGIPPSEPVLLDTGGAVISGAGVDPLYLDFEIYEPIAFFTLGFSELG